MNKSLCNRIAVTKIPLLLFCIILMVMFRSSVMASSELPLPSVKMSGPKDWIQPVGQRAAVNHIVPSFSFATISMNEQLLQAALHLSMPEKWTVNEPVTIKLSFQIAPDDVAMEHALTQPYNASEGTVRVAPTLQAQLESAALGRVELTSNEIQPLSFSQPTQWQWQIYPDAAGDVALDILLSLVTEDETLPIQRWQKTVTVKKPLQLYVEEFTTYLQKKGTWILLALVAVFIALRLLKGKSKPKWIETENYSGPDRRKSPFDRRAGRDRRSIRDEEKLIRSRRRGDDRRINVKDRRAA